MREFDSVFHAVHRFARNKAIARNIRHANARVRHTRTHTLSLRRVFQFLQIEPIIVHIGYTFLDALMLELMPELARGSARADKNRRRKVRE